ncbi:hypothetical protein B0T25DRAFT_567209 [Lasiosphaeria hispida]|uniref:Uncharacterized protein n=1 Tax=Lasiosphaeria hispida TaxID=260671 RepID=A0AAJ0MGX8_9PEZI|nr:hypothetical protein B0T25DRAFT_567209 [Lasiosphaeria hispida]
MKLQPMIIAFAPLVVAASAGTAAGLTVYGANQLDNQVSSTFLDSLQNTTIGYNIYVDDLGVTVVVPTVQRAIDFDGEDAGLFDAITAVNDHMFVAAESNLAQNEAHTVLPSSQVTHEWLVGQGASGKEAASTRPAGGVNGLSGGIAERAEAAALNYFAYLDDHKGCTNHDLVSVYEKKCNTYASAYASVFFENPQSKALTVTIWPHHDCSKGDQRAFVVSAKSVGSCQARTTYSFSGQFK